MSSYLQSSMEQVGEILSRQRKYSVPPYQRSYSWTEDQIHELWQDLVESKEENRPEYFLGAIVLQQEEFDKRYVVIDGQQRLTTILILLAVIREIYHKHQDPRAEDVQNTYFGTGDRRTRDVTPKFELNEINDSLFRRCIVTPTPISEIERILDEEPFVESNRLMLRAMTTLWALMTEKLGDAAENGSFNPEFLIDLEEYLKDHVKVIQFIVTARPQEKPAPL